VRTFPHTQGRTIVGSAARWDRGQDTTGRARPAKKLPTGGHLWPYTQALRPTARDYDAIAADDRGYGWVTFAGVLLLILGSINFIEGLAAIGNARC